MTKTRLVKFDDQAYYVYLGLDGPIGTIRKMDDNYWHARTTSSIRKRMFHYRAEAAEWLRAAADKPN